MYLKTDIMDKVGKFGYDEVVDTLGWFVHAVGPDGIRDAIPPKGTKFDLVRFLFAAANEYPKIKEAVEDAATFWAELKDLFPTESKAVVDALRSRFPSPDKVQEEVIYELENLALTQDWMWDGKALLDRWGKKK